MAVLQGILKEELRNSLRMQRRYRQEMAALPPGGLIRKTIKGKPYHYLVRRRGGRVVFEYKGRLPAAEAARYHKARAQRRRYRRLMADLRLQISFLRRALHERKRRSV